LIRQELVAGEGIPFGAIFGSLHGLTEAVQEVHVPQ
jgi:hypothetical protein